MIKIDFDFICAVLIHGLFDYDDNIQKRAEDDLKGTLQWSGKI